MLLIECKSFKETRLFFPHVPYFFKNHQILPRLTMIHDWRHSSGWKPLLSMSVSEVLIAFAARMVFPPAKLYAVNPFFHFCWFSFSSFTSQQFVREWAARFWSARLRTSRAQGSLLKTDCNKQANCVDGLVEVNSSNRSKKTSLQDY